MLGAVSQSPRLKGPFQVSKMMSPRESCCASFAHSFERLYQETLCHQSHEKYQLDDVRETFKGSV